MESLTKILEPTKGNFELAANCVKDGGVIVTPSDTNLALTLNPWCEDSIDRVFKIKNRPATSPLTLFLLNPEEWQDYADVDDIGMIQTLVEAFWPGPLNIILRKKETVPSKMVCGGETIAMGCLSNPIWKGFMKQLKTPVAMTSANLSGKANGVLVDLKIVMKQIGHKVDYILDGEPQGTTKSSTIIDLSGNDPIITRYGDISLHQINKVLNF
ncbi:L-threonylcarbamoyladenylate synthase [Chengkuizengella axinellae]|uniref:L-threonylcarbamoyladenylate synthase n=1 Tax=Chengkuizengella axinellae TaxID=3064388 RepID=A0ABT9J3R7_9BACL|nr:L-threonylcarbamoyladenylate synthase [Chengkuizengella sp. 2205SS18-9]MDP5276262.1 L-threonylcarbamoyladenylate synthase [Chengkuizengella sp. 2205SS18-9]